MRYKKPIKILIVFTFLLAYNFSLDRVFINGTALSVGKKKRKWKSTYWGVWQFCKTQYIILYIKGITHPNGSLILSPKSPNLKSQSSLCPSLSPKWLVFHQYSPYHIACLCFGENLIPSFSLLECSRKGFEDFLGNNNNIFPVRGFPCRRWHGSRGR